MIAEAERCTLCRAFDRADKPPGALSRRNRKWAQRNATRWSHASHFADEEEIAMIKNRNQDENHVCRACAFCEQPTFSVKRRNSTPPKSSICSLCPNVRRSVFFSMCSEWMASEYPSHAIQTGFYAILGIHFIRFGYFSMDRELPYRGTSPVSKRPTSRPSLGP